MKNKPIVAGNWKMNKTIEEGVSFVGEIQNRILDKVDAKVIFCPPFTVLLSIVDKLFGYSNIGCMRSMYHPKGIIYINLTMFS